MTEVEIYQPRGQVAAREPQRDIDSWIQVVSDVIKIANVICDTPFVPDGLRGSAPAVAAAILSGREMGLGMMTSLANIDVIKGKPTQKALLMRAMILSQGHKWTDVDVTDTRVVVKGCRKGESEWTEVAFTADQAKRAGIDLGKYPADKLYARASSRLARRKFADVIMGMPYTPEDLEDGVADDEVGTVTEPPAAAVAPANGQPKPRTAQRKPRNQDPSPAEPSYSAAAAARPAEPAGEALPPLPGEEETPPGVAADAAPGEPDDSDYDTPGTATSGKGGQLTALWTILKTEFGFGEDEKEQARAVVEHIVQHKLTGSTTASLSFNEARTVLDTLAHWLAQAKDKGDEPRDYLIAVMVAEEAAGDGQ
jgi:hypothetical protein